MEISAAWLRSLLVAVVSTAVWLILAARRRTAEAVEAGEGVAVSCTAPHRGAVCFCFFLSRALFSLTYTIPENRHRATQAVSYRAPTR